MKSAGRARRPASLNSAVTPADFLTRVRDCVTTPRHVTSSAALSDAPIMRRRKWTVPLLAELSRAMGTGLEAKRIEIDESPTTTDE